MRLFRDLFTNDELFTDGFAVKRDGATFEVKGKYIKIGAEDYGISANADEDAAEGATGDGTADTAQQVVDVVYTARLQETAFDKKSYMTYIKGYMKRVQDHLEAKNPERVAAFKTEAAAFVKKVLEGFSDYQFFLGESGDFEGHIALCKWEDDGSSCTFYFFADGIKEEKV
eukprot:TRINITY_DN11932_c0_g1_i1.p2 TRINITY_DN11932_c0_g1~~TRINITY_DN11932_c0_g1_i1.p2  ORF type:complete len:171 (+),score=55.91 TRINITY_DN11932_c0_g1_i1:1073-1585(+)